jgi:hypothetical protein
MAARRIGFVSDKNVFGLLCCHVSGENTAAVRMNRPCIILFKTLLLVTATACAHPEDQCEMQVKPAPYVLEVRFTFNLLTVTKCVRVDGDGDGMLNVGELKAAEPAFTSYLNEHIKLEVNQKPAIWGEEAVYHYLWPRFNATSPLSEEEYAGRHLDVIFVVPQKALLEDFRIRFEIFEQAGRLHTINGRYQQDERVLEVPFSLQKPEHTFETGYVEESVQNEEPSKKVTKPAEAQKAAEQTINSGSMEGCVLLAAVLLALGSWQVRKRRRS